MVLGYRLAPFQTIRVRRQNDPHRRTVTLLLDKRPRRSHGRRRRRRARPSREAGAPVKRVIAVGGDSIGFGTATRAKRRGGPEPYTPDFLDGVYYGPDVVPPRMPYLLGDNRLTRDSATRPRPSGGRGRITRGCSPPRPRPISVAPRRRGTPPSADEGRHLGCDGHRSQVRPVKGKVKEGRGPGDRRPRLEAEGHGEQAKGTSSGGEKIKDVFRADRDRPRRAGPDRHAVGAMSAVRLPRGSRIVARTIAAGRCGRAPVVRRRYRAAIRAG